MRHRAAVLLALALCCASLAAAAQEAGRVYRLGFLWLGASDGRPSPWIGDVRAGLSERGFLEGRNLVIEIRDGKGQAALLPEKANELVALKVDAIFTQGTSATLAAKAATQTVPVVFGSAADPVGKGIVTSLARPGGNVTGFSLELGRTKAFEFLKELAPGVHRIGLLYDPADIPADYLPGFIATLAKAAEAVGATLVARPVKDANDIDAAFAAMLSHKVEAVVINNDASLGNVRGQLASLTLQSGLPSACLSRLFAVAGCLFSYGEDQHDQYRRAAAQLVKIWQGAKPGELPVEQATKFELVINLKTARALKLTVSPSLLAFANEVIE
jgi:putative tryptophan/tyrosine transport system substrate-binding protein